MTYYRVLIHFLLLLIVGCNEPAQWSETLEWNLKCDMNMQTVSSFSKLPIEKLDAPRAWMTHIIRDDQTELWLGFKNEKLKWAQIAWAEKMMRIATFQRIDLCGIADSSDPNIVYRLPNNVSDK